ncbi:MAG: VWA domain-containing protein [Treponema sp.]|jgi:hypothetical protein|nr:VWA domain-containing protein [Treponema sp.]
MAKKRAFLPKSFMVNAFMLIFLLLAGFPAFAQNLSIDLSISPADIQLEQRDDGGFHLFIRKKPGIASVLLTESTRDPTMEADNYAYRAQEWNPVNGDEIRLLNGVPIPRESRIYSLISSTPVSHPELGEAFQIFVPWVVVYGYEGGRYGEVQMADGTYINIRAFSLPYADYRGSFADNPFLLQAVQRIPMEQHGLYLNEAERSFMEISRQGEGDFAQASSPPELIEVIESLLIKEAGKSVDIVLCLDTTGSMAPYIDGVRKMLIPMLWKIIAGYKDYRIGMVLYRDYPPDLYITKIMPFTRNFDYFQRYLNTAVAWGGGDIPEAIYEALYDGAEKFPWAAESRLIILVGDAPPHPEPKGDITREMAYQKLAEKGIKVNAILLPQ